MPSFVPRRVNVNSLRHMSLLRG